MAEDADWEETWRAAVIDRLGDLEEAIARVAARIDALEYAHAAQAFNFLKLLGKDFEWNDDTITHHLQRFAVQADDLPQLADAEDCRIADRLTWCATMLAPMPRPPE